MIDDQYIWIFIWCSFLEINWYTMLGFRHLITIPISLFAFITTFYSIGKLISFLSTPHEIKREYTWILSLLDNYSRLQDALYPLAIDLLLIVSFILQHSFLKEPIIKNLWDKLGLATLSRSIYNLASAATLLVSCTNIDWSNIKLY